VIIGRHGKAAPGGNVAHATGKRNNDEKIGAGEGIRTLDPDLGKVVLYP
jgi:hypothetical protein